MVIQTLSIVVGILIAHRILHPRPLTPDQAAVKATIRIAVLVFVVGLYVIG
jgi:hypothetical protein